jgi:hypothetical protein
MEHSCMWMADNLKGPTKGNFIKFTYSFPRLIHLDSSEKTKNIVTDTTFYSKNVKGRYHVKYLALGGGIILKCI